MWKRKPEMQISGDCPFIGLAAISRAVSGALGLVPKQSNLVTFALHSTQAKHSSR